MRRGETPILFVAEMRTEEAAEAAEEVEGGADYMRAAARAAALGEKEARAMELRTQGGVGAERGGQIQAAQ